MKTYRYRGHSRSDPAKYRPDGELDAWKERDPILVLGARLDAATAPSSVAAQDCPADRDPGHRSTRR